MSVYISYFTNMITTPIKTRIFREHESLTDFIREHIKKLPEKSIIVVTSKIVALAEGRTAPNDGPDAKERLIRAESESVIQAKHAFLTLTNGMLVASAGIDASNADGKFILLPKDSYRSARDLRKKLLKIYGVRNLGVLITDSRTLPLRAGVIGVSTGFAGFGGLRDYRGTKDIFGRELKFSRTNIADCLASAAVVEMGEAAECQPLAVIRDATVKFTNRAVRKNEILIPADKDLYAPLLAPLIKKKR
jgi:coenzyme F420-0:L-glutamate ligase